MANEIATGPDVTALMRGLRTARSKNTTGGSKSFLKFTKGDWLFGKDNANVAGEVAILLPSELRTGYVCWTDYDKTQKAERKKQGLGTKNELLGEEMALASAGGVDINELPDHAPWEWKVAQEIVGKFIEGDQAQFRYNTSSYGGLSALGDVMDAVMERLAAGETVYLCPVVQFEVDSYVHKDYGPTKTPDLQIVGWADVNGEMEGGETLAVGDQSTEDEGDGREAPDEEPDEAPVVRRKRRS